MFVYLCVCVQSVNGYEAIVAAERKKRKEAFEKHVAKMEAEAEIEMALGTTGPV